MATDTTPTYDPRDQANKPGDGPLRVGGQAPTESLTPQTEQNLPSTQNHQRKRQEAGLKLVRDLWDGPERVRDMGHEYLPQAPGEDAANYAIRLKRSVFHNFYRRSVEGLTGLIFRKDVTLGEDVPPQIVEHWENIDQAGMHGTVFARELVQDALCVGGAGILVEYPDTGGERLNRAQEMKLRPYWVPIKKDDITSWRTMNRGGATILTQLVIRECAYAPAGDYGEAEVTTYRVLYLDELGNVLWKVVYETKDRAVVTLSEGAYPTQQEIPFAEITTSGRRGILDSDPPLLDMAYLNVAHYQQWSDAAFCVHKTNVPFVFLAGITVPDGEKLVVGANTAMSSDNPQASAQYVSHDGAALNSSRQMLEDLKADMGTLGIAMLAPQKRAAETAEAKRLDKATSDSALSTVARSAQDAIERALGYHARYLKLNDGGSCVVNRDFEGILMDASIMSAYAQLVQVGFPGRIILKALQEGGRIPEDEDLEALEIEMEAGRIAEQDRKQQEAKARTEALVEASGVSEASA